MPSASFTTLELLAAVRASCTVCGIHRALGARCHRSTVWRGLVRAMRAELVERTAAIGTDVWELTDDGRRTLDGKGSRPRCPKCETRAGSRLVLVDTMLDGYGVVPGGQLRCRWCGHLWHPSQVEREAAEAADRTMSTDCDELALALACRGAG